MLDRLYSKVKQPESSERFSLPELKGHVEGNKTMIENFFQICDVLRRKKEHLLKYLSRELAALGVFEGERLVFNRRLSSSMIKEKLQDYVQEFVICKECKKPDTEILKEQRFMFLHCLACGAKYSVRAKIV